MVTEPFHQDDAAGGGIDLSYIPSSFPHGTQAFRYETNSLIIVNPHQHWTVEFRTGGRTGCRAWRGTNSLDFCLRERLVEIPVEEAVCVMGGLPLWLQVGEGL